MTVSAVLDAAGTERSPATLPGYSALRPPPTSPSARRAGRTGRAAGSSGRVPFVPPGPLGGS